MSTFGVKKIPKTWLIIGTCVLVLVALLWSTRGPDMSKPEVATTVKTYELYMSTLILQASFSSQKSPKDITSEYLILLDDMRQGCKDIHSYQKLAVEQKLPENYTQKLNNSMSLCDDLARLIIDSKSIYTPTQELLSANTKLKRYEKISFIENRTRKKHLSYTDSAIRKLEEDAKTIEYHTQVVKYLKQLRSAIISSKDTSYIPELKKFQNLLLAERQQYWTASGDLAGLNVTLLRQIEGYCQDLKKQGVKIQHCHAVKAG